MKGGEEGIEGGWEIERGQGREEDYIEGRGVLVVFHMECLHRQEKVKTHIVWDYIGNQNSESRDDHVIVT